MNTSHAARKQYRAIVDRAAAPFGRQRGTMPREGWIATVRKALGMSGAELAKRLGVTRARISQAERAEVVGGVTLKTMYAAAEAMGCRFVYAIVPDARVEEIIAAQARHKARAIVAKASAHMALEDQGLSASQNAEEIERVAAELIRAMPSDLWRDE